MSQCEEVPSGIIYKFCDNSGAYIPIFWLKNHSVEKFSSLSSFNAPRNAPNADEYGESREKLWQQNTMDEHLPHNQLPLFHKTLDFYKRGSDKRVMSKSVR